jgi:hypothetical protein
MANEVLKNSIKSSTTNVSSLVSPDIVKNVKSSETIKAFGDQLKDKAKDKAIAAATESTLARLYKEKALLIKEGIEAEIKHNVDLLKLEKRHTPTKKIENGNVVDVPAELNDEQYAKLVALENFNYGEFEKNLQQRKDDNQKAIDEYLKDPFAKLKEKRKARKEARAKAKKRNKEEKRKARRQKRQAALKSAAKSLIPVLTLLLTDKIAEIIAQNDTIKKLVDDTNAIIIDANESNDPAKLNNAKLSRDNAIRVIQNNEEKITKVSKQLQRISLYISVFGIIVNTIAPSLLPVPTPSPLPDVVTPPKETFRTRVYEPALKILNALIALLPTVIVSLEKAIQILQDYKAQLLNINGVLENNTDSLSPMNITYGTADYGSYKGFKFALREETKGAVRGNKRHYAVAIDTNNVEVLKSEPSFTLDPNDLIEQLKIIIDRENLIG